MSFPKTIGRFRVLKLLGQGGLGKVYLAEDRTSKVALKLLHSRASSIDFQSLCHEVEMLTKLSHPNLVAIYDLFTQASSASWENTIAFFSMEFVDGVFPDQVKESFSAQQWVDLLSQACSGLSYLHSRNILHGDLKPSNLLVTPGGRMKILDFGLSRYARMGRSAMKPSGTLEYLAPEALFGDYFEVSDLYSLGVSFYESLTGQLPHDPKSYGSAKTSAYSPLHTKRPDLPDYFCDLIDKLLEVSPSNRPQSAASVLRYLRGHGDGIDPSSGDGLTPDVLSFPPFIGREKEAELFSSKIKKYRRDPRLSTLWLEGPTGVGRTRFLQELKWRHQLKGLSFLTVDLDPGDEWYEMILDFLDQAQGKMAAIAFADVHLWPEKSVQALERLLVIALRKNAPFLLVFEMNREVEPAASLKELQVKLSALLPFSVLTLKDLTLSQSKELLSQATEGTSIDADMLAKLASVGGGRPLLLLEALRSYLQQKKFTKLGGKISFSIPRSLADIVGSKVERLSEAAQKMLGLISVSPFATRLSEIQKLWKESPEAFDQARIQLAQKGFLSHGVLREHQSLLAHESLRELYLDRLPRKLTALCHGQWLNTLLDEAGTSSFSDEHLLALLEHAYFLKAKLVLKEWGLKACEILVNKGRDPDAAAWLERLAKVAESAFEKVVLYANLAPCLYRMGKYPEALRAYELWYKDREDDETQLQKVKYFFYTGLVHHADCQESLARTQLENCLRTGDAVRHSTLRPYHARAHSLLAALESNHNRFDSARAHLLSAKELAQGQAILFGEIHQRLGDIEYRMLHFSSALRHYRESLRFYRKSKSTQAEAISHHFIGMVFREQGLLEAALQAIDRGIELSEANGELLQAARYRQNRVLVLIDLAQYGKAHAELTQNQEVFELIGSPKDRLLWEIHRGIAALYSGNWDQVRKILEELNAKKAALKKHVMFPALLTLQAEFSHLRGNYREALKSWKALLDLPEVESSPELSFHAELGLIRARFFLQHADSDGISLKESVELLEKAEGPNFELWKALLIVSSAEVVTQGHLKQLLSLIRHCENPELRIESYRLLGTRLKRIGMENLSRRIFKVKSGELNLILSQLPEELRMDYLKHRKMQIQSKANESLEDLLPLKDIEPEPHDRGKRLPSEVAGISEARFRQFVEINRQMAQKNDLGEILERVMDAAVVLTGAERGLLLIRDENAKSKALEGFEVKAFRHLNQQALDNQDFRISLGAVKMAIAQSSHLLTNNAMLDRRLKGKKSVKEYNLKSILVVPLEMEGQVFGAIYLDHRAETGIFSEENILLLHGFASQAALIIQKAQFIEQLSRTNQNLETKVHAQAERIEVLSEELSQVRSDLKYPYSEIIGQSPAMMKVFRLLDHVTDTNIPVWILGESGTGKELIARSLHYNSPRNKHAFVSENCSAIPESLLESELFGHKKGAFTHADRDRIGLFEQANQGSFFLDEIGDMSLAMQAKLLRVLQEEEVRPLGSNRKIKIDVRLITASNRDLNQMVKDADFRQDLFFRINGLTIHLPPLRERKEDIPLLIEFFIKKISRSFNLPVSELSEEAMQFLMRHSWPGNIRELEGLIRNAMLFAKGRVITPEYFPRPSELSSIVQTKDKKSGKIQASSLEGERLEERRIILTALSRNKLDKVKAAKQVGVSLKTFYSRMALFGIPKKKQVLAAFIKKENI